MMSPNRFKILHISDLHCSGKEGAKENKLTLKALIPLLTKRLPIHFVVFTGDLFVGGGNTETVNKVYNFLFQLKKVLDIEPNQFFFVPIAPQTQLVRLRRMHTELGRLSTANPLGPGVAQQTVRKQPK